ncbi:MAG: thermonuclease family protein [Gammaproteobacteria bacterium]|nr:thermonuclease family protein [Gammaproteobacteria bacterium]
MARRTGFEKTPGWPGAGIDASSAVQNRQERPGSPGSFAIPLFLVAQLFALPFPSCAETVTGIPRVIDADTVHVAGERIRLKDIDAPETQQQCENGNAERVFCGLVSTRRLEARIGPTAITCALDPKRDRYGRRLGTCYAADGENLHRWLVRNGLALAYRKYSMRYVPDEAAARSARVGMWAGRFVPPWRWRRGERLE